MKQPYHRQMEAVITQIQTQETGRRLLLHSCCAPCSSSVIKRLMRDFEITVLYYNPNIDTDREYAFRAKEQQRLVQLYNAHEQPYKPLSVLTETYEPHTFYRAVNGFEHCAEGGDRCAICYHLRLDFTAKTAQALKYDYFCTTLSVSPLKNAHKINEIGLSLQTDTCKWLPSDFKKQNGYLQSVQASKHYGLYRQDYCGCIFSKEGSRQKTGA